MRRITDYTSCFLSILSLSKNKAEKRQILTYFSKNDMEGLGKFYFSKAIHLFNSGKYNFAYKKFVNGYKYITCDCKIGDWFSGNPVEYISDLENSHIQLFKKHFLKAFIFLYSDQYEKALDSIDCFLAIQPKNEIGYYFKGKILLEFKRYSEALSSFEKALVLKHTGRTLYRIGKTREQFLSRYGLRELYDSLKLNLSSECNYRYFIEYASKKGLFEFYHPEIQKSFNENTDTAIRYGIVLAKDFLENGNSGAVKFITNQMLMVLEDFELNQNKNYVIHEPF